MLSGYLEKELIRKRKPAVQRGQSEPEVDMIEELQKPTGVRVE